MQKSHLKNLTARGRRCGPTARIAILLELVALLGATALPSVAQSHSGHRSARASHVISGTETTHLHLVSSEGSLLREEGSTNGALSGHAKAQFEVGATLSGEITIYSHYGDIKGHGKATPRGSGRYQSFSGTLVVTGGTGRYLHAHGTSGFYGVFDRRTFAMTTQTTGRFYY
jgi:hypothetical protein